MRMFPYYLYPRYWINLWKAVRFIGHYGPDQAAIVTRDLSFLDCIEEASKNWFAGAIVGLPHRYGQLLSRIQQEKCPVDQCDLVDHNLLAAEIVVSLIQYEGYFRRVEPHTIRPEGFLWQSRPIVLETASADLRQKIKAFEADFAKAAGQFRQAYYWSQNVEHLRKTQQERQTARK